MSLEKVVLLLGSDLGDRKSNLENAKVLVNKQIGRIVKEGEIMETEPVGFTSETKFLNQIIEIKTDLSPIRVLKQIKSIEKKIGRIYTEPKEGEKYSSRIIDIDLLFYEMLNFQSIDLVIPHPQVVEREFVRALLNEL